MHLCLSTKEGKVAENLKSTIDLCFKELLGSFVEGTWQALQLTDTRDTTVALLKHYMWRICHLLQQFPHLLDYAIHDNAILNHITECVLTTSTGDPYTFAVSVETNIPVKFSKLLDAYCHICGCVNFLEHDNFEKFDIFPSDFLGIAYSP